MNSNLGGGKFLNGAISAAFSYAAASEAQGGFANDNGSSNDSATNAAASSTSAPAATNSVASMNAAVQASAGMGVDSDDSDIETVVVTGQRDDYNTLNLGQFIQIAAGGPANDNFPRNWVCTEASYNCITKAPPGQNRACFTAQNLCDEFIFLQTPAPPNGPSLTVTYPYKSGYVIIYPGGAARYIPGPSPYSK